MTPSRPQCVSAVIRAHFCDHQETFVALTSALAADAARFDDGDRRQRLRIMAGALQGAAMDNTRFWTGLQQQLHGPDWADADGLAPKIMALADFAIRQSLALLSLRGDIAPLLTINQSFLAVSSAGSDPTDNMYIFSYS